MRMWSKAISHLTQAGTRTRHARGCLEDRLREVFDRAFTVSHRRGRRPLGMKRAESNRRAVGGEPIFFLGGQGHDLERVYKAPCLSAALMVISSLPVIGSAHSPPAGSFLEPPVRAKRPDYGDRRTSRNSESVAIVSDGQRHAAAMTALARLLGRQAAREWLSTSYSNDAGASHG
jgi:hypothetical protein